MQGFYPGFCGGGEHESLFLDILHASKNEVSAIGCVYQFYDDYSLSHIASSAGVLDPLEVAST